MSPWPFEPVSQRPYRKSGVEFKAAGGLHLSQPLFPVEEPGVDVIIVDEIGKMELLSAAFRDALQLALASPKPVVASTMSGPQPWVDAVKARPDVTLVEVTRSNRKGLPDRVFTWLGGVLSGKSPA